jgi:hypothetical protein
LLISFQNAVRIQKENYHSTINPRIVAVKENQFSFALYFHGAGDHAMQSDRKQGIRPGLSADLTPARAICSPLSRPASLAQAVNLEGGHFGNLQPLGAIIGNE